MDLFYWYLICKLLKALTWKDLFLFILYCGSGYILQKFWVYPPVGNEVYKVLMKELPSPWNPVAIFHSNKSCCKLRTTLSKWKRERGLVRVPWSPLTGGSPSPDPAVFLTLLALWELTGHVSGLWRVNHNRKPSIQFGGLVLVRLLFPLPLWGTERIKRRGGKVSCLGGTSFPQRNCTFCWILCSLLWQEVHLASGP